MMTTSTRPTRSRGVLALVAAVAVTVAALLVPGATPARAEQNPAPRAEAYGGYLFAYFTGEGRSDGEQVYFAVSRGNSPLEYDVLNGGAPALVSTVGTRGVRDPFVLRKQDGTFVLIATDLRIHGNGNWDGSQRTGSRSIVIWESADLVTWSAPRLAEVAGPTAGNVWAPEAIWDPSRGAYVVFWASKLYATTDPNHTANTHNRMLYATTTDFRTFSAPQVWNDPGYSVIDSTIIEHQGVYHRFTKDERGTGSSSPCGKFVTQDRSTSVTSRSYTFVRDCIGRGSIGAGEGPTVVKSNTADRWYLFIDEYGGRGYIPFTTTDLNSGSWTEAAGASLPANPRHGSIVPITTTELNRLARVGSATTVATGRYTVRATTPGFTDRVWAHRDFVGRTEQTSASSSSLARNDATFDVVAGLADPSCRSFRSVNYPDRYLRHQGYTVRLDTVGSDARSRADATFCAVPGRSGTGVSWRAYDIPTRYLRHYGNALYLAADGGPFAFDARGSYAQDTTWRLESPLAP